MLDQFARQNRWWYDPAAIASDRHLSRLRSSPLAWQSPLPFQFDRDAIYTLRGPRQVGKSTVLKRQIEALLEAGWPAQKMFYLDVELAGLENARDLIAALRAYLDLEGSPPGVPGNRLAILLDEVNRVENWAGALRGMVDNDELRNVTIVATGSHTRDLRRGMERLPGRRGGGAELDLELLPLSFREYLSLVDPSLQLPASVASIGRETLAIGRTQRQLLRPRLGALFGRYLATGGFLVALNDEASSGRIRAETFQLYREAIVGEFTRAGLREAYLREVVNWVAGHLGQEFDARGIAADTDIGSKDTAQNYVDQLLATYVTALSYRTPNLERPALAFRAPRKLHPVDPLFWHLIRGWAASDPDPWQASLMALGEPREVGHLVESVVAVHLRRAFGDRVFYWRPDERREIDFVVAPPDGPVALAEAKYQSTINESDARPLVRAGGGVILTRDQEGELVPDSVYMLPVSEFLALLETPSLGPQRLS
jgi:uncharacterized protein